jgi:hypothetical protein
MGLFDFMIIRTKRLPEYGKSYFQHVIATLILAAPNEGAWPQSIRDIVTKYRQDPHKATWGDLCLLEKFALSSQSDDPVKRRAWALRSAYFDLVGAASYEKYLQSHPPNENDPTCNQVSLRADLDRMLDSLHWNYALIPIRERLRTSIVRDVGFSVAAFVVIDLLLILWCSYKDEALFATMLIAMLAGATGGFISLQQRVQAIPTQGDPLISIFELENGRFSIFQAPISGSIFALLLLFLFMGGLVSGQLFPIFDGLKFFLHKFQWTPAGTTLWGPNYAKLIVWCFIAGFAERFVPDTLDRLIAKSRNTDTVQSVPPQPAPPFPTPTPSPLGANANGIPLSSPPSGRSKSPLSPWR